jgi:CHAD domain-containing protein
MTAIRVFDELAANGRWPALGTPAAEPVPADMPAEETARVALERLDAVATPEVRGDEPWTDAGRTVIRRHLTRMLGHVGGALDGHDPEEVHAMRVAGRRVRAGWRVFGDGFEAGARRRYRNDLRAIGGHLGAVRDMDVRIGILDAYAAERSSDQRLALEPLSRAWLAERGARHAALATALRSTAFERFVADYLVLALEDGLHARPPRRHRPATVRTRMPAGIWEAYQAVWAFDAAVPGADMATLHQLRIEAKWLRYAIEFVREPLEPEATSLLRRVVALQDRLGDIHDLDAAATLARTYVPGSGRRARLERAAIERFERRLVARTDRLRREVGPDWRRVSAPSYRRMLGGALARL